MDRDAERYQGKPSVADRTDAAIAIASAAPDTSAQHRLVAEHCASLFVSKLADYGPAWRMFRLISLVDQIYIKARRIRRLEELQGRGLVEDSAWEEYVGILNYAVIGIWQLREGELKPPESLEDVRFEAAWTDPRTAAERHLAVASEALGLLARKNHDYGEAWREMAIPSITDELLGRCLRIKSLLEGVGETERGGRETKRIEGQLHDAINYAAFALIRLAEGARQATAPDQAGPPSFPTL